MQCVLYTWMSPLQPDHFLNAAVDVIFIFQEEKDRGEQYYCLSDFICPKDTEKKDFIGLFAVSAGFGINELCAK